jgi:hypothetical protein
MNGSANQLNWRTDDHAIKKYQFMYHFLPHPHEKRRATLLLNKALVMYCFLIVSVGLVFRLAPLYIPGILGYASNVNTTDLLRFTNQKRQEAGVANLTLNSKLSLAAQRKAEHMFAKGYWAHIAPDGTEPWDFILGANYNYTYAGENLAKNFSNSKDVVNAWFNSSSHKQNLLNTHYSEVGYAAVNGVLDGYETTIVVQMFGNPRVVAVAPSQPIIQKETQAVLAPESPVRNIATEVIENPQIYQQITVKPVFDVRDASKVLSGLLSAFIVILLAIDLWYSKKMGITKINGNAVSHIVLLIFVIASIWFVLKPGAIL